MDEQKIANSFSLFFVCAAVISEWASFVRFAIKHRPITGVIYNIMQIRRAYVSLHWQWKCGNRSVGRDKCVKIEHIELAIIWYFFKWLSEEFWQGALFEGLQKWLIALPCDFKSYNILRATISFEFSSQAPTSNPRLIIRNKGN